MAQNKAIPAPAGFLVLSVDTDGGEMVWAASPTNLDDAIDTAKSIVETTMNPDEVVYVIPSIAAYRPTRD